MIDPTRIGNAVRAIREAKNLSIEQLATDAGIDRGNLSRMERGEAGWNIGHISKTAKALSVTAAEIVSLAETQDHETTTIAAHILAMPERKRKRLMEFILS